MAMRMNAVDEKVSQSEQRQSQDNDRDESLLTPARRAALDALEREFHALLQAQAR